MRFSVCMAALAICVVSTGIASAANTIKVGTHGEIRSDNGQKTIVITAREGDTEPVDKGTFTFKIGNIVICQFQAADDEDGVPTVTFGKGKTTGKAMKANVVMKNGLTVDGDANFRKILLDGEEITADYVFEAGYKLESIEDHAKYMTTQKHLPAIPSAKHTEENGLDLGRNNRGIVEELEKAHLYINQLNEQNKMLLERLTALEGKLSETK